jgi:dihydropyrimidinase
MAGNTADYRIKGGVVVNAKGMKKADVFVKDGIVESIASPGTGKSAKQVIDATGKYVLPGIIDAHQHPFYADKIDTLSRSAAFGGITTLIPYIGAVKAWGKGGDLLDAVKSFIDEGENSSVVDFGIHCSVVHDDMELVDKTIPEIIKLGTVSFKGFMAYAKRGMMLDDLELIRIMDIIAANGGLFAVHAENGIVLDHLEDGFIAEGKKGPEYYYPSHPNIAEAESVFRILTLATTAKCPLYLVHLSARESLEVVELFRKWGEPILYTETCSHYLTLTDADMKRMGSLAKVGPPLREKQDVEALWKAVDEGRIDVIGSDTAGHMVAAQEPHFDEVFKAPSGLPGQETMFIVTYDEGVNKGRTTLPRLVELTSERPAKIFGIYPRKGVLAKGSDADLVIFDPTASYTIEAATQHATVDYTMYEGRKCLGAPTFVMQRGKILVEDGELKAKPGQGKYLPAKLN